MQMLTAQPASAPVSWLDSCYNSVFKYVFLKWWSFSRPL